MNYIEFSKTMNPFLVFSPREIKKYFPVFDSRRLVEWQAKGYIRKLRNRYYCFTHEEVEERLLYIIANKIYEPSYLSLETALSYYGFIPEGVFKTVSCTTLKTQSFSTSLGRFNYRHIKPKLFFGYRFIPWQNRRIVIAEPEKTLIDYLYLQPHIQNIDDFMALRWNKQAIIEQIDLDKLTAYDTYISSHALSKRLRILKQFLYAEPVGN